MCEPLKVISIVVMFVVSEWVSANMRIYRNTEAKKKIMLTDRMKLFKIEIRMELKP